MSGSQEMPSARRRPIPGMAPPAAATPPHASVENEPDPLAGSPASAPPADLGVAGGAPPPSPRRRRTTEERTCAGSGGQENMRRRRPAADYATTRLVNFRIPVDLHNRFKLLVREVEHQHPRLRHPSLTELVIALLEEGPQTPGEAAQLIRRKRTAEHSREA